MMELVRQKQRKPGVSPVVPNETYAMIADVLAGKTMTELSANRANAAAETAQELMGLMEQGVGTSSINANFLIMQIMDIYESGNTDMAQQAEGYFEDLLNYGLNLDSLNVTALKGSLASITDKKCKMQAEAFADRLLEKADKTF